MVPSDRKSEAKQERDLAKDLDAIRAEYSGLDAIEPPALLDQAILNTARREMAAGRRRPMRWIGAFATASVFVLALTLVIQQDKGPVEPRQNNGAKQNTTTAAKAQAEFQGQSTGQSTTANAPQSRLKESGDLESAGERKLIMKRPAAAKAEEGQERARLQEAADFAAEPELEAASAPATEEMSSDRELRFDDAPADLDSMEDFRNEADDLEKAPRESGQVSEENRTMEQAGRTMAAPPAAAMVEKKDKSTQDLPDPEEWIQRLLLLNQSQLYEKLEEELAAFRVAYPDYPIPPELEE